MKKMLAVAAVGIVLNTMASARDLTVAISSPTDGSSVVQRPTIEGIVSDNTAPVWVVVHPLEVSNYWVQPRVSVRDSGSWKVQIYIGRPGAIDVGKHFEVRVVANSNAELREGMILDDWPKAAAISNTIELIRR